ncbi:putative CRISPR-associated protein Cas5 [Escherichia coli]|uniref:Putative CRISPR-associated protein Cas5 n=5 Tax=Enterobacterales TaxID=91347 RepID=A0A377CWT4_ECOLX|nr:type I-E CRISPR-associated protein Cas5/CasD [Escherichia coli]KDX46256.1 CRISPR-associated protein Cas5/CasD [Escherichia coli 2-177-06_S3_C2]SQK38879.1 putative CRISPR-associated protein Cas5 [Escherichia coli]SQL41973.1 putative CRISPR-associated protein Cas5 [Escherichia coli]SQN65720.1 putative CRISPR-associated protein Cas5 [Escherichia coli]SQT60461.1 putative CRISPR-associated protein Cas5 [Escherichia coli]
MEYLVFQLYAPLASWGVEAPGEIRHSAKVPTRSALLGLLCAALGIRRDEEEKLNAFNQHYHFAIHALASRERWLRDYHTVSAPRENKKYRYYTRRDEICLDRDEVSTLISQREYRCDGYWHIALSATPDAPVSLQAICEALVSPCFPLYLGRKSCPLALPLAPRLMSGSLKDVLIQASQELMPDELRGFTLSEGMCYWDDPDETSLTCQQKLRSNHQPLSRQRWQFGSYTQFLGSLKESA